MSVNEENIEYEDIQYLECSIDSDEDDLDSSPRTASIEVEIIDDLEQISYDE